MTCIFSALIYGRNVCIWEKFNEFIILVEHQATFIFLFGVFCSNVHHLFPPDVFISVLQQDYSYSKHVAHVTGDLSELCTF